MNHKQYDSASYKSGQADKNDRLFGPVEQHQKICVECRQPYTWVGRHKTKGFAQTRFCSKRCTNAHNVKKRWQNDPIRHYRTICFRYHKKQCVVCPFTRIVEVHHRDEDRRNNHPRNLIPLCSNHHKMAHMNEFRDEIDGKIETYLKTLDIP